jgi:hypothetical protein
MRRHLREMGINQGDTGWPTSMIALRSEAIVSKQLLAAKRNQYAKLMSDQGVRVMDDSDGEHELDAKLAKLVKKKKEAEPKKKLGRPHKLQRI